MAPLAELRAQRVDGALAGRSLACMRVEQIVRVCRSRSLKVRDADSDQPEFRAVDLLAEQFAPAIENTTCELRRVAERTGAGAGLKVRRFEFQRDGRPADIVGLEPCRYAFAEIPQDSLQRPKRGDVGVEGGFRGDAFRVPIRNHLAVVDAAGEPAQPLAFGAEPAHQFGLVVLLNVGDGAKAVAGEPLLRHLADAEDDRNRLLREKGAALRRARALQSRAACRGRMRSWRETCCRTARSTT